MMNLGGIHAPYIDRGRLEAAHLQKHGHRSAEEPSLAGPTTSAVPRHITM